MPFTSKYKNAAVNINQFFGNLLLDTDYKLKNGDMYVDYVAENDSQSIISKVPKSQFDTLDCTLEELAILNWL